MAGLISDAISILLIHGNDHERERYAQRLQASSSNYDIAHAATGRAGLDHCARQPIDCVVLEIDLPDMSGFEVLAKLVRSACYPKIAVVILTALSSPCLLEEALKNGAQAALYKTMLGADMLELSILNAIASVKM